MFELRNEQLRALKAAMERRFLEEVARRIRRRYPALVAGTPRQALLKCVAQAAATAHSRGVSWQSAIALFIELKLTVGPGFDRHPRVRAFLEDPSLSLDERVLELGKKVSPRAWRQIRGELHARPPATS